MMFPKRKRIVDEELLETIRTLPCIVCRTESISQPSPTQPCHVTSRGAGGDDVAENVIPMCFTHHRMQHDKGWGHMVKSFNGVRTWMRLANRTDILELGNAVLPSD